MHSFLNSLEFDAADLRPRLHNLCINTVMQIRASPLQNDRKEKTVSEICSGEKLQLELWVNQSTKSKHTKLHYSEKYWMKRKHISFWLICNACKWTPIKTLLNTKILFLFWFWFRCCCGCLSFFVEIARIFLAFYSLTCIFRLSTILGIVHLMSLYYM